MKTLFVRKLAAMGLLLASALLSTANATLATDLQNLLTESQALNTQISSITLTSDTMCTELLAAHNSAEILVGNINAVDAGLGAPLSIDTDSLQALDDISNEFVSISSALVALSENVAMLNTTTEMARISQGMSAMLRLSDDIGIMADRILEMADRILLMADNIGIMADRIITTQQIQSDNIALTQSSMLTTQQNILALVSVVNSSDYQADFESETLTGNTIAADISTTTLTSTNMARKWGGYATDVESLKQQIETTHAALQAAADDNTVYTDVDSYAVLADMSIMVNSIAVATEGLALASQNLSPVTSKAILSDSVGSMLQMSSDIGIMADRILGMADLILAMADNIGLTADQILATQQLQSTYYGTTLASIEATQSIAITLIELYSL